MPDDLAENIHQPFLATALIDALGANNRIVADMLIASNVGLVSTVNQKTIVKAPDWLFVPKVVPVAAGAVRRSYTLILEGEPVAIVMEFLSESDTGEYSVRPTYPYGKWYFYEQILNVPTYTTFNPCHASLEVRRLQDDRYVLQSPNDQGRYWIPEIGLFLGGVARYSAGHYCRVVALVG